MHHVVNSRQNMYLAWYKMLTSLLRSSVRMCMRVVRACVRACVRARARACARASGFILQMACGVSAGYRRTSTVAVIGMALGLSAIGLTCLMIAYYTIIDGGTTLSNITGMANLRKIRFLRICITYFSLRTKK